MALTPLYIGLAAFNRLQGHETYCEHEIKELSPDGFAYIWSLGVSPKATGRGFGGQMIQAALSAMRSSDHSACLLKTENQRNVSLYEHLGFKKIHIDIVPDSRLRYWIFLKEL
jgi:ribosomal protein S18 acetylase RimI-like enzyme